MAINTKELIINAQKVVQPLGEFLILSLKPIDLVGISFVDVRRIGERDVEKALWNPAGIDRGARNAPARGPASRPGHRSGGRSRHHGRCRLQRQRGDENHLRGTPHE